MQLGDLVSSRKEKVEKKPRAEQKLSSEAHYWEREPRVSTGSKAFQVIGSEMGPDLVSID